MTPPHPALLAALVADAPDLRATDASSALQQHAGHQAASYAGLVGPLVLPDTALANVGRQVRTGIEVEVGALVSGGAGGLVALGRRAVPGLRVSSATSVLRDLDDLAGAAARVVAAAEELEGIEVFVGLPDAPGWLRAVEVVEAAGLLALVVAPPGAAAEAGSARQLAEQLSVLIEADLPFALDWPDPDSGVGTVAGEPGPGVRLAALLLAVEALVDGADPDDAAGLIGVRDHDRLRRGLERMDEVVAARVRRRLRRVSCPVAATVTDLAALGVIASADPVPG